MSSEPRTALIYTPRYLEFDYGPGHPLRNERLQLTYDLIGACDLLDLPSARYLEPQPATDDELLLFLTPDYLTALKAADNGQPPPTAFRYGLGTGDNPVVPGIYRWSALVAGGSLLAMRLIETGEADRAFNMAGGLHHAGATRASGFCYINDAALIIAHLCRKGHRVAYVDIDVHHGDGVQWAFYDTDQVLTVSIHESGRTLFPGTGFVHELGEGKGEGYSVNVPLPPLADDEIFLWAFDEVVPPLVKAFRPDILVTQLGIDSHRTDPLSHVGISLQAFARAVRRLRELCGRWIALGGGGYDLTNVARGWTAVWAIMNDREPPASLPEAFLARQKQLGFRDAPFMDGPAIVDGSYRARAWEGVRDEVQRLKRLVFARHGIEA
jgi:acetoin utilization protein AcuC